MNTLALEGWRRKLPTKKAALRELMTSGRWVSQQEMAAVAGYRYGSALFDIHNEADIAEGVFPVHYETRCPEGSRRVSYRQTDKAHCDICSNPKHMRPSERIAQLEKRIAELEAENAEMRGLLSAPIVAVMAALVKERGGQ